LRLTDFYYAIHLVLSDKFVIQFEDNLQNKFYLISIDFISKTLVNNILRMMTWSRINLQFARNSYYTSTAFKILMVTTVLHFIIRLFLFELYVFILADN
jgi:hypothetical protein